MAASQDRATRLRNGDELEGAVYQAVKIYAGTMVQRNATGYLVPASATIANKTLGVAEAQADNSAGASGDIKAKVRRNIVGCFANSSAGDLIAIADIKNDCYVVDDVTVAKTDGTGTRPVAGKIIDVDSFGVWVEFA